MYFNTCGETFFRFDYSINLCPENKSKIFDKFLNISEGYSVEEEEPLILKAFFKDEMLNELNDLIKNKEKDEFTFMFKYIYLELRNLQKGKCFMELPKNHFTSNTFKFTNYYIKI